MLYYIDERKGHTLRACAKERYMYENSVRWFDEDGYDHITKIEAKDLKELAKALEEFKSWLADIGAGIRYKADPAPVSQQAAKEAPQTAPQAAGPADDTEWYDVNASVTGTFKVMDTGDNPHAKVMCKAGEGDWSKWGVTCWKEPFEAIGINLSELDEKEEYSLPSTVMGAVVLFDPAGGKSGRGTPKKIKSFRVEDEIPF